MPQVILCDNALKEVNTVDWNTYMLNKNSILKTVTYTIFSLIDITKLNTYIIFTTFKLLNGYYFYSLLLNRSGLPNNNIRSKKNRGDNAKT